MATRPLLLLLLLRHSFRRYECGVVHRVLRPTACGGREASRVHAARAMADRRRTGDDAGLRGGRPTVAGRRRPLHQRWKGERGEREREREGAGDGGAGCDEARV